MTDPTIAGEQGRKYTRFIEGELIDLCVPSRQALADGWGDWFNDSTVTRYLDQGVFPNLAEQQEEFYESLSSQSRLVLMVCDKAGQKLWGTISLSAIDWVKRSAQISLVVPQSRKRPPLAPLEAMARMSEHGFLTMGLDRIWAGQAYPALAKWSQRIELLGYRAEGILRRSVTKGRSVSDEVAIASLYEDYVRITAHRPYWPGAQRTQELLKRLPKAPLAERIAKAISDEQTAYEREIDGLEQR